jgi:hypothetical protein
MPDRLIPRYATSRHWKPGRLPQRWVFPESRRLPWITAHATGPDPLNVTAKFAAVCADAIAHIDLNRIAVTFTPSRQRGGYGLQAKLTPMKLKGGSNETVRRGRPYVVQRFFVGDVELLYVLTFVLPRLLDRPFEDKLVTIFHELYHVGEAFDGDIRRHAGRYHAHSHSKCEYDEHMTRLVHEYLAGKPDPTITEFLHHDYADLWKRHGGVYGTVLPRPKLVPVSYAQ